MLRPQTWRVTFAGKNSRALIFDEHPSCSDGDEPWAFGLILEHDGGLLRGCCRPKRCSAHFASAVLGTESMGTLDLAWRPSCPITLIPFCSYLSRLPGSC